ncbi:MAG: hypothetical protein R3C11_07675 [Planctomycetaceae bacterium]
MSILLFYFFLLFTLRTQVEFLGLAFGPLLILIGICINANKGFLVPPNSVISRLVKGKLRYPVMTSSFSLR